MLRGQWRSACSPCDHDGDRDPGAGAGGVDAGSYDAASVPGTGRGKRVRTRTAARVSVAEHCRPAASVPLCSRSLPPPPQVTVTALPFVTTVAALSSVYAEPVSSCVIRRNLSMVRVTAATATSLGVDGRPVT